MRRPLQDRNFHFRAGPLLADPDPANPASPSYEVNEGRRRDGDVATDIAGGEFVQALGRTA